MTTILHGNVVPGVRRLKTKTAAAVAAAEDYLPTPRVARRYDVTTRTIERWEDDTKLRFASTPSPLALTNMATNTATNAARH